MFVGMGNGVAHCSRSCHSPWTGAAVMQPAYNSDRRQPPLLESIEIVVAVMLMALGWFAWYVARERYHLSNVQIAEIASNLAIGLVTILGFSILLITARSRREKQWPHPPMVVSRKRDERLTQRAWQQNAVILGYDIYGRPWYWPDRVRVMQGIVLGMPGARKTTPLRNIITQDLTRVVGTAEH